MQHLVLMDEARIDTSSNLDPFRTVLPELIFRLIAASINDPINLRIPSKGGTNQTGFDGIVESPQSFKDFVPDGLSVWEFSTGQRAQDRATENYTKRTGEMSSSERAERTFVFVTPRSAVHGWDIDTQTNWINQRSGDGWKSVKILDATRIVQWLYFFPEIDFWLADQCGFPTHGLTLPSTHWEMLETYGAPPSLKAGVFLKDRQDALDRVIEVLRGNSNELKLESYYPEDVVDFVVAALHSLSELEKVTFAGRCLIVDDPHIWKVYSSLPTPHVLVGQGKLDLGGTGHELRQFARRGRHGVIFSGSPTGGTHGNVVRLRSRPAHELERLLVDCGYNDERARNVSNKSKGQLAIMKRLLQDISASPDWASNAEGAELRVALLIGEWNELNDHDRMVLEEMLGKTYGEWINSVRPMTVRNDPPLIEIDGKWRFISRYEGWQSLGPYLGNTDLLKFELVAKKVLGESDPALDLEPGDRWMADVKEKKRDYSSQLRSGLAETLALLGAFPEALTSCTPGLPARVCASVVSALLEDSSWRNWASVRDVLPQLAEASPESFLGSVKSALRSSAPPFAELFSQEGGGITGTNYMTGLLWGLECVAWNADYLIPVTLLLGQLAEIDPGGNWVNRPKNSLSSIFLPWFPQTEASLAKRKDALEALLREHSSVGREVLKNLLPDSHQITSGTYKPSWREWISVEKSRGVTNAEYWNQISAYSTLIISAAGSDLSQLVELVDILHRVPRQFQKEILNRLSQPEIVALDEAQRVRLWEALTLVVERHTKYASADWAMPSQSVRAIATVADRLAPRSAYFRNQPLFNGRDFDHFDGSDSYEVLRKRLEQEREIAVSEVVGEGGFEKLFSFAHEVEGAREVGTATAGISTAEIQKQIVPTLLESTDEKTTDFVAGYVWASFWKNGWNWVDALIDESWSEGQKIRFFVLLPFSQGTWERAERSLGSNAPKFWRQTSANAYGPTSADEVLAAIPKLLAADRAVAALDSANRLLHDQANPPTDLIFAILEKILEVKKTDGRVDQHHCVALIEYLQKAPDTDRSHLFRIEWSYLAMLGRFSSGRPLTLESELANNPDFFCLLIQKLFRSKNQPNDERKEASENEKQWAQNAYHLLKDWRQIPGLKDDDQVDGSVLNTWIERVRSSCKDSGHLEVADSQIGSVLSHFPKDPDGTWISHPVAAVLDREDADKIRHGFVIAVFNQRGVFTFSQGKGERELAATFREKAEVIEARYPRLATAIRSIEQSYISQADREEKRDPFDD